ALIYDIARLLDFLAASGTVDTSRLAQLEWISLPFLRSLDRPARALSRELALRPSFFMEVLRMVFRAHGEEPSETTDQQQAMALLGYQLLDSWQRPPGRQDDGTVDEEALNAWVNEARILAATYKREKIADQQIGRVLRYVPDDADGMWPHRTVRNLVERIASRDLETGLELGLRNSRGATWRGLSDGGAQERALQARYLDYAQHFNANWPRTAAMLRRIARSFAEEARREDEHAEIIEERRR
ncbi:MAG TPA: XRE family transcriptional regulator, partial [Chloroflexota bacterium]|nr:XRE family transcriptional regulator [Chloroflexota bacterium]